MPPRKSESPAKTKSQKLRQLPKKLRDINSNPDLCSFINGVRLQPTGRRRRTSSSLATSTSPTPHPTQYQYQSEAANVLPPEFNYRCARSSSDYVPNSGYFPEGQANGLYGIDIQSSTYHTPQDIQRPFPMQASQPKAQYSIDEAPSMPHPSSNSVPAQAIHNPSFMPFNAPNPEHGFQDHARHDYCLYSSTSLTSSSLTETNYSAEETTAPCQQSFEQPSLEDVPFFGASSAGLILGPQMHPTLRPPYSYQDGDQWGPRFDYDAGYENQVSNTVESNSTYYYPYPPFSDKFVGGQAESHGEEMVDESASLNPSPFYYSQ
ncbi:unnamed protein product [Cyclocybe aegerita]|uniref:Uncharacterized protein n=1 Tax=Cyclocybe aegerita TaxID=1973307 RepID=A0A8S0WV35_CYCAE|nr:unnamed protein product [Cyclocybe aegerita]